MISKILMFDVDRLLYMRPRSLLLSVLMIAFLGACKARTPQGNSSASASISFDGGVTGTRPPLQRVLLVSKKSQHAEDVEAFFKTQVLPVLVRDNRVGNISTYVTINDGIALYGLQVDLRTWDMPALNLALDILRAGQEGATIGTLRDNLTKFLDLDSAKVLYLRPELSVTRDVVGTVGGI